MKEDSAKRELMVMAVNQEDFQKKKLRNRDKETWWNNQASNLKRLDSISVLYDLSVNNKYPMENKVIQLRNTTMPIIGLGTHQLTGDDCINSVRESIKMGYRLIDTAECYQNHQSVAEGIK